MTNGTRDAETLAAPPPSSDLVATLGAIMAASTLPGEDDNFGESACQAAADFAAAAMAVRAAGDIVIRAESPANDATLRSLRLVIVNDDMPFLVDSVSMALAGEGIVVRRLIHPVVSVARDDGGRLTGVHAGRRPGDRHESLIYMEIDRIEPDQLTSLEQLLRQVLGEVRAAVRDWLKMQVALGEDAEHVPDGEGAALLRWLLDRNFTLLGSERMATDGTRGHRLGIAATRDDPLLNPADAALARAWFEAGKPAPLLIKSRRPSNVHRNVLTDLVIVPVREGREIVALSITAGIWTSAALASAPDRVPVLRAHMASLLGKFGFDPGGHAGKALAHALTELPHDVLVTFSLADLERVALTAMSLSDRPRPKLLGVTDALQRQVFLFVWLPRDELSTGLRMQIQGMLTERTGGRITGWSLAIEDGNVAILRYVLDIAAERAAIDEAALDAELEQMVRGWEPAVEAELGALDPAAEAVLLARAHAGSFPVAYRVTYGAGEAARDIMRLRGLDSHGGRDVRLYRLPSDGPGRLRLKVYQAGDPMALSAVVPVLEDFGFTVIEEVPTDLAPAGEGEAPRYIDDFALALADGADAAPLLERATTIEEAVRAVLSGTAENDAFNRLITEVALAPVDVVWLRAWFRYLRQTGLTYGLQTVVDALARSPDYCRLLIALFRARHDPAARRTKGGDEAIIARMDGLLVAVKAIDDDRILRRLRAVVTAILRTNAFVAAGDEALAFKIDSAGVPGLPAPVPWREVWIYSPRVEGIHLRAGPVARGGIRWSDRRDDFRTEILGLMKAQRVKNAVIVPTGAKGGFFAKRLPNPATDRDAWLAEGTESYRIFIRTLLSITDNIVDGQVVHPAGVVVRDGDDPYFVVAADKGTASFSDVANAIAQDHGFWLGDAFASGGSHGYDHKAMGITARGAWISVQRHFAEMGVDVQVEPTRVVGVGDMSGDVFGNGMLLSPAIRLVAAFDHRHIFIDPDPDAAAALKERQRLFALPRSSWADYDAALISRGGGIHARTEKSIPLSVEARALLGLDMAEADPATIITAILKAQVDLLWFGGIGTYVKARGESHADVGDPANDAVRINGDELRARVVGEGANLGVTQAGRIAYALAGGRINTDFIDNSAGVDCSDNEVNIKIALNADMAAGRLTFDARNTLLTAMTDAVADIVLEDNRLQTLALSIEQAAGVGGLASHRRLIDIFEGAGRLDRAVEGIAGDVELARRAGDGHGLTRPELAVLLATAKLALQDAAERGALGATPALDDEVLAAFPDRMRAEHRDAILAHRLRGEIIATKVANRMVNRMGIVHPFELAEEEGAALAEIMASFLAVERLYGLRALWDAIDAADLREAARIALFDRVAVAARAQMADLVRSGLLPTGIGESVAVLTDAVGALGAGVADILTVEARRQSSREADALVEAGVPRVLAERVVHLRDMDGAIGIAALARTRGMDPVAVANAFTRLGTSLGLGWAQAAAAAMTPSDPWERLLVAGIARDLQQVRLDLLTRAPDHDLDTYVAAWVAEHGDRIAQFRALVARAQGSSALTAAMLAQIAGQARVLLAR